MHSYKFRHLTHFTLPNIKRWQTGLPGLISQLRPYQFIIHNLVLSTLSGFPFGRICDGEWEATTVIVDNGEVGDNGY